MATSTKVQFDLETLKAKALEAIDLRIRQKQLEVDSYESDEALQERVTTWRARQEEKVSDLFRRLGENGVDDLSLSRFKLDPIPEVDKWDRERAVRDLNSLEATRAKIVAKSDSLVADDQGHISLTKTQLSEFFGL